MAAIMVQGTSSSAGKTFLVTALCRILARRGLRVAPFKAVNMSNNARVVHGLEMPTAQYFQALAADTAPDVRMAPILVKPESVGSQVVVLGEVDTRISALPWQERADHQWPHVAASLEWAMAEHDVVVIEGAGSPAEINLRRFDVVNMAVAAAVAAPVLLVSDIDRGGSFAHMYGTWALLPPDERDRFAGFVLNKFRGDPRLLADGPAQLEALTGVPTVAVVPWIDERLPEEDGFGNDRVRRAGERRIGVVAYPSISNHDEFRLLGEVATVSPVRRPVDLGECDLIVLPGSKDVAADLRWLRSTGFDAVLAVEAGKRTPILGICGGLQMLGGEIVLHDGVTVRGLGMLPMDVRYDRVKLVTDTRVAPDGLDGWWSWLNGRRFDGYEIRQGRTTSAVGRPDIGSDVVQAGSVVGVSAHGLFENPNILAAFTGHHTEPLDAVFDRIADRVEASFSVPFETLLT